MLDAISGVMNRELAARFLSDFDQDLRASRGLELDSCATGRSSRKHASHFWSYFGEVL